MLKFFDAAETDSSIVYPLIRQLWTTVEKSNTQLQSLVDKTLSSSTDKVVIASLDGESIGIAVFSIFESDWLGGKFLYLHAFVVDSKHRGRGFGKMLLGHRLELARKAGLIGIELDSGPQRAEAHAFYERVGFKRVSFLYTMRL